MKKGKKGTTYIEATLKPDFSKYIKDGKFDALDALEDHAIRLRHARNIPTRDEQRNQ